jgi:hypothetical protein
MAIPETQGDIIHKCQIDLEEVKNVQIPNPLKIKTDTGPDACQNA